MNDVTFLILRRLRAPLITLIVVYAISVGGLAIVPGVDPQGNVAPLSVFHAFYVMSYTATTIGFGELPHPFTDAQRLWVTFSIYLSVVGWAYTLGSVISLANDATFRTMLARSVYKRRVRGLAEPFYVLCGYGQSGARLARALDHLGNRIVIIERDPERAARTTILDFNTPPITLTADARLADVLEDSGIHSAFCRGLIALTGEDAVNQAIAIGARVLNPALQIVARAKSDAARVNLESFGGVQVINPFETFAANVGISLRAPVVLQVEEWLTAAPGSPCPETQLVPRGRWVLVGFGRFGRALAAMLDREGIEWRAFDPVNFDESEKRLLHGDYTENVLKDAGINEADVLVAGADVDAINLGATTLARRVKPDIFVVIRQNQMQDRALIEAADADLEFVQSDVMVHECLQVLTTPMLGRFLTRLRGEGDAAQEILTRVRAEVGNRTPRAWEFECDVLQPGMFGAFFQRGGAAFTIGHLVADPTSPRERLRVCALAHERSGRMQLLPPESTSLKPGDRILFVGNDAGYRLQRRYLVEPGTIQWVCSGEEPPQGFLFRWWRQRSRAAP